MNHCQTVFPVPTVSESPISRNRGEVRNSHEGTTGIGTESAINLGVESEFQEHQNRLRKGEVTEILKVTGPSVRN